MVNDEILARRMGEAMEHAPEMAARFQRIIDFYQAGFSVSMESQQARQQLFLDFVAIQEFSNSLQIEMGEAARASLMLRDEDVKADARIFCKWLQASLLQGQAKKEMRAAEWDRESIIRARKRPAPKPRTTRPSYL